MKKIAVFTEGQTEQLLSEQIIKHIAGEKEILILKKKATGGNKNKRQLIEIEAKSETNNAQYFVLLVNCDTDNKVKSDIRDQHSNLHAEGYQKIIGIRDVYPDFKFNEIEKLRNGLSSGLPNIPPGISFVLGIMEIESWLIGEHTHFTRIDPAITPERIKKELEIDVIADDLSQRPKPSEDLKNIYWLENIYYDKSQAMLNRILNAIDRMHLKNTVAHKFEDLLFFCREIESFFT